MNQKIADEALRSLRAIGYPKEKGLCQKQARLIVQNAIGHKYDDVLVRPSAKQAALSLLDAGLAFRYTGQRLEIGDLVYKVNGSGGFGHVGVVTPKGICENSTYHWNRSGGRDARGIRSVADFGHFDVVARFPSGQEKPAEKPASTRTQAVTIKARGCRVTLNGKPTHNALIANGKAQFSADHLRALGATVAYDEKTDTIAIHKATG